MEQPDSIAVMKDGEQLAPAGMQKKMLDLDAERILHAKRQRMDGDLIENLCEAVFYLQAENVKLSAALKDEKIRGNTAEALLAALKAQAPNPEPEKGA